MLLALKHFYDSFSCTFELHQPDTYMMLIKILVEPDLKNLTFVLFSKFFHCFS